MGKLLKSLLEIPNQQGVDRNTSTGENNHVLCLRRPGFVCRGVFPFLEKVEMQRVT